MLTPHNVQFHKPVTITFSWTEHADSIGLLPTFGLAYQGDDGIWMFAGANSIDVNAKTVSVLCREALLFRDCR
jgi:hypothetical protein